MEGLLNARLGGDELLDLRGEILEESRGARRKPQVGPTPTHPVRHCAGLPDPLAAPKPAKPRKRAERNALEDHGRPQVASVVRRSGEPEKWNQHAAPPVSRRHPAPPGRTEGPAEGRNGPGKGGGVRSRGRLGRSRRSVPTLILGRILSSFAVRLVGRNERQEFGLVLRGPRMRGLPNPEREEATLASPVGAERSTKLHHAPRAGATGTPPLNQT